jgi:hypothetical protein
MNVFTIRDGWPDGFAATRTTGTPNRTPQPPKPNSGADS